MIREILCCTLLCCDCTDCAVVFETCRECDETLETVDREISDGSSLSEAELSSRCSSRMDSAWKFCDAFVARGRMTDHGGDSFNSSAHSISPGCASHSASFFETHGF